MHREERVSETKEEQEEGDVDKAWHSFRHHWHIPSLSE